MHLSFVVITALIVVVGQTKVKAVGTSVTYEKNIDLVKDYVINSKDIAILAKEYNKNSKSSGWNKNNDLNNDGVIDLYDLILVSKAMGKKVIVDGLSDFAEVGQKYTLQSTIKAKLGEKDYVKIPIKWSTTANTSVVGTYNHTGVIDEYNKSITFKLIVVPINIDANLNGLSFMTYDGNHIYYCLPEDKLGLYKANLDGSNAKKLSDDDAYSMNYYNGWIYYILWPYNNIYKIRTDGTGRTLISEGEYEYLKVHNGKLYCVDYHEKIFYSMNLDGTNKKAIVKDINPWFINIVGNHIYYVDSSRSAVISKISRVNLDGSSLITLNLDNTKRVNVFGNYIYYQDYVNGDIIRTNLDGTNKVTLVKNYAKCYSLYYLGDWIYTLYWDKNNEGDEILQLGRIKSDGSKKEKVIDIPIWEIDIRCGKIYIISNSFKMYIAKMDGTDIQLVK